VRLAVVDHGHRPEEAAVLDMIRERSGNEPLGVVKTLLYRPDLFGPAYSSNRVSKTPCPDHFILGLLTSFVVQSREAKHGCVD